MQLYKIFEGLVDNTLLTVVLELTSNDNEDELRADGVYVRCTHIKFIAYSILKTCILIMSSNLT